jgi:hypothetical protein
MDRVTVSSMIARACERAGLEPVGAHLLRHSLGEAMIRAEVRLAAIGQVLRHHDPLTTTNYARVDIDRLRVLARPWPILPPYRSVLEPCRRAHEGPDRPRALAECFGSNLLGRHRFAVR